MSITQAFKKKDQSKNSFYALNGVTFTVNKGDFFGILGRNGSGKSTLLKIISDIYQPTSGTSKTYGRVVSFIELGVGFKSELTGKENVYLNGALLGFSRSEIDQMYDDIVSFAELEKFMDQKLKNYSSGMKVRLAFSVAIRAKADVLVLDEVLAVGDAAFQKKCNTHFQSLRDEGVTVVLVTHNMNAVRRFCNRAIVIDEGKVAFDGPAEDAAAKYMSLFPATASTDTVDLVQSGTGRLRIQDVAVDINSDTIAIRAELFATEAIKDVKFGVSIKNEKGRTVTGVNTIAAKGGGPQRFKKNERKQVMLESPNILGKGVFDIEVAAVTLDGERLDMLTNVAKITNDPLEVKYPTVLPATMSVTNDDGKG